MLQAQAKLVELNKKLNATYIAFGNAEARKAASDNQVAQDANAARANQSSLASRVAFKARAQYSNARWDLVDACRVESFKIEDLKEEELPDELKKLSVAERKALVEKKSNERKNIQKEIKLVSAERSKYVAAARKKLAVRSGNTLDAAIIAAVRGQAKKKNFTMER